MKDTVGLSSVDNTSDLAKPISTLTQTALDALNTTVSNQGSTLATKADTSTLQSNYYTKTEVDNSVNQKQASLTVAGNDINAFKIIDSSQNVRSLKAQSPLTLTLNNTDKSLTIGGPAAVTANGDNTSTNGYSLLNNSELKAMKSGGYIELTSTSNDLTISTTANLQIIMDAKANRAELPNLASCMKDFPA